MTYKTVTVDIDVDIDLDEFDDSELIDEMNQRGYACIKEEAAGLEREDWQYLIEMLDKNAETWYTRRVRDKLLTACHGSHDTQLLRVMAKVLMIYPPSGWQYGFPKPVHEEFHTLGDDFNLEQWLISEGYPEQDIELALKHSRYWEVEEEDLKGRQ